MKNLVPALLLLVGFATISSCSKDDDTTPASNTVTLSGTLAGANEVPAVTTSATGSVTGTYNKDTNELKYTVTYANLTGNPLYGHFHIGAPGVSGPVSVTFPTLPAATSGTISATQTNLTQTQEDELLKGNFYANIHTPANPGGEIRANIVVK